LCPHDPSAGPASARHDEGHDAQHDDRGEGSPDTSPPGVATGSHLQTPVPISHDTFPWPPAVVSAGAFPCLESLGLSEDALAQVETLLITEELVGACGAGHIPGQS